jgi:hypothetical protein
MFLVLLAVAPAFAAEIPAGTNLQIRLTTPVDSASAHAGDPLSFVVIAPVLVESQPAIAQGAVITGSIASVTPAKAADDHVVVALGFASIRDDTGRSARLSARLTDVDNAREDVDDQGRINGIVPKDSISSRIDQGIGKLPDQYSQFAQLLGAVKGALVKETDPNIVYPAGVEMTIVLTQPLNWNSAASGPPIGAIEPADLLGALAAREPYRTITQTEVPSDITNLMFIGSREELERAFREAGWSAATRLNGESKLETFRAIAEMRGYQEAPVSLLLLNGRAPDLVYQKQNNTFAARHHLRIWLMPDRFDTRQVWVCAATHDIGISFSDEQRTFIHKIDSNIDHERAKVVSDLLFTRQVTGLALVDRDAVPHTAVNGTGDQIETDGRMAVVRF